MAVREPIERRSAVVFDARPPARGVAAAFRPRDLDQQWEDGADGIIPTANNEPPPLPEELLVAVASVLGILNSVAAAVSVSLCFFHLGRGERRRAAQHSVCTVAARQARDGVQS